MAGKPVLLVIDMQVNLLERSVMGKEELIHNVNQITGAFADAGLPIFYIRHTNKSFLMEGTDGWRLDPRILHIEAGTAFNKSHSSVFKEKAFGKMLQEIGAKTLVLTGLVTNGCVQAACADALENGYGTVVISDGHSTFHKDAASLVPQWNAKFAEMGARVMTTEEFLEGDLSCT